MPVARRTLLLAASATVMGCPLPRSEMAWGVAMDGHMHLVGGYGEQRVDRPYHHFYDPRRVDWHLAWEQYAPMPAPRHDLGAATIGNTIYVAGGGPVMGGGVHSAVHEAFVVA